LEAPRALEVGAWKLSQAVRHTIGWFDFGRPEESGLEGEAAFEGGGLNADAPVSEAADLLRRLAAALQAPLTALDLPGGVLEWPAPLLPYQREGVLTLLERRELLLADAMGLGKTVQAIAALRILFHQSKIESALVVAPASLLLQWRRELLRWAPDLKVALVAGNPSERGRLWQVPAHIRLVGYETLRADVLDLRDSPALRHRWGVVVLDEASKIKNRRSAVSIACKRLPRERRWALTGTPMENSVEDVVSLLEFLTLDPENPAPQPPDADLKARLHALQLRRKKEDVLPDLPPRQINEVAIELPPGQRAAYDRAEQEGLVQLTQGGGAVSVVHVLELISRLKQLCNYDPVSGESGKLADIAERMRSLVAQGQRALIFSQFTDAMFGIARAKDALQEFHPLVYTGSLSSAQRAEVVRRFMADPHHKALLLSLRAGGIGLNLQAASYVFHLDRWWNPAIEEQADSRAHRLGQTYPVTVYRYTCVGTIEERIDARLKEKRQAFHEMVDDVSLDIAGALSEAELFGLFGLTAPRRPIR
jgi:SNF2 family DNA or RNA helicase